MNTLVVSSMHKDLYRAPVERFDTIIDGSTVSIGSHTDELDIFIHTEKDESAALALFSDVFSLLFVYLGAFPVLKEVCFNGNVIDTSEWIGKYKTQKGLFRQDSFIAEINGSTVNQHTLDEYRKKQLTAIYSLQYLVSEDYRHVIIDHRITLLTHIIDGIYEPKKQEFENLRSEIRNKYQINDTIGDYLPKVYYIANRCFFCYDYYYEILNLLKIKDYTFLRAIADTRNWNSHYLRDNKLDRLKDRKDIAIFFEIIFYMIRISLAMDFGVQIKEDNVKEHYFAIHDWLLEILYNTDEGVKSKTYKDAKQWAIFLNEIKKYTEGSSTDSVLLTNTADEGPL